MQLDPVARDARQGFGRLSLRRDAALHRLRPAELDQFADCCAHVDASCRVGLPLPAPNGGAHEILIGHLSRDDGGGYR